MEMIKKRINEEQGVFTGHEAYFHQQSDSSVIETTDMSDLIADARVKLAEKGHMSNEVIHLRSRSPWPQTGKIEQLFRGCVEASKIDCPVRSQQQP
jgi:hypothetical protein